MNIVYLKNHRRRALSVGKKLVDESQFAKAFRVIEDPKSDGTKERDWIIKSKVRPKYQDCVVVTHFDQFGENTKDLLDAFGRLTKQGAVVIELVSGRRSDKPDELAIMVSNANSFYAGKLSSEEMSEIGKLGAQKSPVTKRAKGHLPFKMINAIMDNMALTFDEAVAEVERVRRSFGKKYPTTLSGMAIRRMKYRGEINFRNRISGMKPKT